VLDVPADCVPLLSDRRAPFVAVATRLPLVALLAPVPSRSMYFTYHGSPLATTSVSSLVEVMAPLVLSVTHVLFATETAPAAAAVAELTTETVLLNYNIIYTTDIQKNEMSIYNLISMISTYFF
jgi:hypothetical protein